MKVRLERAGATKNFALSHLPVFLYRGGFSSADTGIKPAQYLYEAQNCVVALRRKTYLNSTLNLLTLVFCALATLRSAPLFPLHSATEHVF